jgi:hypothetical protein
VLIKAGSNLEVVDKCIYNAFCIVAEAGVGRVQELQHLSLASITLSYANDTINNTEVLGGARRDDSGIIDESIRGTTTMTHSLSDVNATTINATNLLIPLV